MIISSVFKPILKFSIYHSYFLNDGQNEFSAMDGDDKAQRLKSFNWKDFMEIKPTPITNYVLQGQKIGFYSSPSGFRLGAKVNSEDDREPYISLSPETVLTFYIQIHDPYFWNYTNLEWGHDSLLYFSNKTPQLPEAFSFERVPMFQHNKTINEDFVVKGENRKALLDQFAPHPNSKLAGLIHIQMKGDTGQSSLINNNGKLKNNPPHFKVHFENQKTIWKYIHRKGDIEMETKKAWPLTKNGFISLDPQSDLKSTPPNVEDFSFPNPTPTHISLKSNKIYSEIFI